MFVLEHTIKNVGKAQAQEELEVEESIGVELKLGKAAEVTQEVFVPMQRDWKLEEETLREKSDLKEWISTESKPKEVVVSSEEGTDNEEAPLV